jgi:hypothetical protein
LDANARQGVEKRPRLAQQLKVPKIRGIGAMRAVPVVVLAVPVVAAVRVVQVGAGGAG